MDINSLEKVASPEAVGNVERVSPFAVHPVLVDAEHLAPYIDVADLDSIRDLVAGATLDAHQVSGCYRAAQLA